MSDFGQVPSLRTIWPLVALGLILLIGACTREEATFPENSFVVVANSDLGPGESLLQIGVIGPDGERLGGPDTPVEFSIGLEGDPDPARYPAEWIWLIPDVAGLYRAEAQFDQPGIWTVAPIPESGSTLPATPFQVLERTIAPAVGDPAPVAPIETLSTRALDEITTDPTPDPDFYGMTLEDAFGSGNKTVVVFSTPAFCQTATCGPILDIVKSVKPEFPDVNFVHVEVYTGFEEPGFVPSTETLVPAVLPEYWNLPSEPWVFVVDESGVVAARFEGGLVPDDLRRILG